MHFGAPISTVINNALADFSFDGDARSHADTLTWEHPDQQFSGTVQGALNTVQAALLSRTRTLAHDLGRT